MGSQWCRENHKVKANQFSASLQFPATRRPYGVLPEPRSIYGLIPSGRPGLCAGLGFCASWAAINSRCLRPVSSHEVLDEIVESIRCNESWKWRSSFQTATTKGLLYLRCQIWSSPLWWRLRWAKLMHVHKRPKQWTWKFNIFKRKVVKEVLLRFIWCSD